MESLAYALAYLLHNDLPWSNEQPPDNGLDNNDTAAGTGATAAATTATATAATTAAATAVGATTTAAAIVSIPSLPTTKTTTINNNALDGAASTPTTVGANQTGLLSDSDRDTLLIQQVLRVKEACRDRGYLCTPIGAGQHTGTDSHDGTDDVCGADKVILTIFTSHTFFFIYIMLYNDVTHMTTFP